MRLFNVQKMKEKINLQDVTFLIPLRIDSLERIENITAVTSFLLKNFKTNIFICEADKDNSGILKQCLNSEIKIFFVRDSRKSFHRTYYINELVRVCSTEFIAIWDADVVVDTTQITVCIDSLRKDVYDFIYPYDGAFMDTGVIYRRIFVDSLNFNVLRENSANMGMPYTDNFCGGGFFARREYYIKVGMENENFSSWGPEDGERLKRWRILQTRIGWVKGKMFHLYHSRGINSRFKSEKERKKLLTEADRIGNMSREELEKEIINWKNKINSRKKILREDS